MQGQCELISENVSGGITQDKVVLSPEEFVKEKNFKSLIIGLSICVQCWRSTGDRFFMEMN